MRSQSAALTEETDMKKLLLLVLLQAALMGFMVLLCIQAAIWAFALPAPLHIIVTFLSWVGLGISWQEIARRFPGWLGLEKTASSSATSGPSSPREP
jgi:hypothetical protein